MSVLAINDLPACRRLDLQAMTTIRGGGAPWIYGWIRPYVGETAGFAPVVNFYQINNYADQMNNQFQTVNVSNSAANSNINVAVAATAANVQHG